MGAVKAHEVRQFIDNRLPRSGIFLAYGPDAGMVSETGRTISRKLCAGGDNLLVFEAMELDADPGKVAVEARTPSLFGDKRVMRVRGVPRGFTTVVAGLAEDVDDISLVIEAGDLKKNDPLRVLVEGTRNGWALPCFPDDDRAIQELVTGTLRDVGISADQAALTAIRENLGNDREVTRRELEKLVAYAGDTGRLTDSDVLAVIANVGGLGIDNIIDAVALGKAADFDEAYRYALANGADEQQILAMTLNHFRNLRRWRAEIEAGASAENLLRPVHFKRKDKVSAQLRLWRDRELQLAIERIMAGISETRKNYDLRQTICPRALLAISMMAAER